ncbi:MAG TPA: polysaccharide deacetylase family protein [Longimicrobium sp.]|jgi:peptidoglycan/xylan/chitin deacetylase (PgdA/CDA1 family)|uniref:polysaccharide deacetylase family protein n=1 Tax=Longimicrobium sp. TaxID=2029185 RepID=UPI002EDA05F9
MIVIRNLLLACTLALSACAPSLTQARTTSDDACGGTVGPGGVPVLAWHGFAENPRPGEGNLTESWARYEETLRFLADQGFRSVFPEDTRLPGAGGGRQVILTFDDGRKEQLRAAEMLERHGFRGIFFVIPRRTRPDSDAQFLNSDDVARLARAGHRVSAHGYEHRSLPTTGTEVAGSLVRSPGTIARHGGDDRLDFAFPFGHYTPEIADAIGSAYRHLHTVNPGYWDGRSALLPRMLIMNDVQLSVFTEYLLGGATYAPVLRPVTPDGAVAGTVTFVGQAPLSADAQVFAVSADAQRRSYIGHPLGENLRVSGDTVTVDLAAHMGRYHGPGRGVISYAIVSRRCGAMRYLSPGIMHWIRDPAVPPSPLPTPVRPETVVPGSGR